jgi:type I protein arginine methyltransferase
LPIFGDNFAVVLDAKARLLAPGGVLVPRTDTLFAALVEAKALCCELEGPYGALPHGFVYDRMRSESVATLHNDRRFPMAREQLLGPGVVWATLRYGEPSPEFVGASVVLPVTRSGECHGLALWFEAELTESVRFDTSPGTDVVYGRAFAPLLPAFPVEVGQALHAQIGVRRTQDGHAWGWALNGVQVRQQSAFQAG